MKDDRAYRALWFVALPVTILILQTRFIDDLDMFTQVKLGLIELAEWRIVSTDLFTFTHNNQPFAPTGWIAQILFALSHQLAKWPGVQLLHVLLFSLGLTLSAHAALRILDRAKITPRPFVVIVSCVIAALVVYTNSGARPQSFAVFGFGLNLAVLESALPFPIKAAALLLSTIFWQNAHLSASIWLFTLGIIFLCRVILRSNQAAESPTRLLLLAALSGAALFITPLGADALNFGSTNARLSRELLGISEWLPPWAPLVYVAMVPFWVALALSLLGVAARWRTLPRTSFVVFCCFTALSLYAARFSLFWALIALPLWMQLLEQLLPTKLFKNFNALAPAKSSAKILAAGLTLLFLLAPPFLRRQLINPLIPLSAIEDLHKQIPTARIYNYREWGGPLTWIGYPGWQLLIDGRLYLYSEQEWQEYNSAALGKIPVADIVAKHRPDIFVLHRTFHERLIELLKSDVGWKASNEAETFIVFERDILQNANNRLWASETNLQTWR
jgi:hypothetical protein